MLQKATSKGIILNPVKSINVINRVSEGLQTDEGFTLETALGLAQRLKNPKESNGLVDFRMVPSSPKMIGGVSYVVSKRSQALEMFRAIAADTWPLPPYGKTAFSIPDPPDVTVRIIDASGKPGLAAGVKEQLRKQGFDVLTTIRTLPAQTNTVIWYRPGDELKVRLVGEYVKAARGKVDARADPKAEVTLVLGSDAVVASPSPTPS
jgi:hypothetical protein